MFFLATVATLDDQDTAYLALCLQPMPGSWCDHFLNCVVANPEEFLEPSVTSERDDNLNLPGFRMHLLSGNKSR